MAVADGLAPPRPRRLPLTAGLAALLLALTLVSVATGAGLGATHVGPAEVWAVLTGTGDDWARAVLIDLRLPRTVLAILVGAGLGVAGVLLQAVVRNPLAEPGLIGVSAGASGAVVLATAFGVITTRLQVPIAVLGALIGCTLALTIAGLKGSREDPIRLILAGAAINGLLGSLSAVVLLVDNETADTMRFWTIGALAGRDISVGFAALPALIAGFGLALAVRRPLSALAVGQDVARGLGHRPGWTRAAAAGAVALLTGAATAIAGPIGFVGLVVPFVGRRLVGPEIGRLLPVTILVGPCLVLAADIATRLVVRPSELPLGIVTAFVGAPVLIALVRRGRGIAA